MGLDWNGQKDEDTGVHILLRRPASGMEFAVPFSYIFLSKHTLESRWGDLGLYF